MSLINWNDSLSTGIKEVDDQHRMLIDLMNALFEAMKKGQGKQVVGTILQELADYTVYHFGTEESLFRKYSYPGAEQHKAEHDAFVNKVIDFQDAYLQGRKLITVEVLDFLTEWLKAHIQLEDKKFGVYFVNRGFRGHFRGPEAGADHHKRRGLT